MPTGWLSRNDLTNSDKLYSDQLNSLANDMRSWGGDVNGGAHRLSNVILDSPGGFATTVSPITLVPGADGQSSILFDVNTATPNQYANRWSVNRDNSTESGGNAGSNFVITRYDDTGAAIDNPLTIRRSDGLISMRAQRWLGPVDGGGQTLSNVVIASAMTDPTTSKGDLITRGATGPPVRLPVGTTDGQVLTVDHLQPYGIKWTANIGAVSSVFGRTGDVVAAAHDYSADLVDFALDSRASYSNPTWLASIPWTIVSGAPPFVADPTLLRGDMLVRSSSAVTRLAAGTDGSLLVADSTAPLGVRWSATAGGPVPVYDEPPAGIIDGINVTFTLLSAPNPPSSLDLFLNGVEQTISVDYTLTGNAIHYTIPPRPGDTMYADYTH